MVVGLKDHQEGHRVTWRRLHMDINGVTLRNGLGQLGNAPVLEKFTICTTAVNSSVLRNVVSLHGCG